MATASFPITLAAIVEREPRVGELLEDARQLEDADWEDYSWYKSILSRFMGWGAPADADPLLGSSEAYMVAIDALVEALGL